MCKDIFINEYEQSDIIENCVNFLKKIKKIQIIYS